MKQVAVSLEAALAIADVDEVVRVLEDDFRENLLARGPEMVMEHDHEWELWAQALEEALYMAAKEGMPRTQLRALREQMLGDLAGAFCRGLTGNPPANVAPSR